MKPKVNVLPGEGDLCLSKAGTSMKAHNVQKTSPFKSRSGLAERSLDKMIVGGKVWTI
ncbi:hypothetical protein AG1IA_06762 [Rhizoctonia solani AG-1 IA]|uniref:Uncharacterized protein n=1 Tax=Thanatephorus cucumeris (strain AG1-IA) TaxID=983506 RepID=L8WS46_THACA|nr:hypothetical protein AG1IA_06762 [Rhizoctonia solani AG-1 IA]